MKWRGRQGSSNVTRSSGPSVGPGGGPSPGMRLPGGMLGGGGGILGIIVVIVIYFLSNGGLGGGSGSNVNQFEESRSRYEAQADQNKNGEQGDPESEDDMADFLSVVLKDTEDAWTGILRDKGRQYNPPKLHLFTDSVNSGCGFQSAQVGPFYCPVDQTVYIDMTFYHDLRNRFGIKGGDFTMAYVLAHEVGHHIQNETGILEQVNRAQQQAGSEAAKNELNVRLELQADYLAGVVAHFQDQQGYLEEGDIQEALEAAEAIGDDTIQKRSQGRVVPDSFTHGTSAQRRRWYELGFKHGDLENSDTFNIDKSELG